MRRGLDAVVKKRGCEVCDVWGLGFVVAHEKAGKENSKVNGSGGELCGVRVEEQSA